MRFLILLILIAGCGFTSDLPKNSIGYGEPAVVVGDSIANLIYTGKLGDIPYEWHNMAIPGSNLPELLARFDSDISIKPKTMILHIAVNDFNSDLDVITANMRILLDRVASLNIKVIIDNVGPSYKTIPAKIHAYNAWLKTQETPNLIIFDFYSLAEDPSNLGHWVPEYTYDDLHPTLLFVEKLIDEYRKLF